MSLTPKRGSLMIVTCASCLTKFSLDEAKLPAQGAKVRCSRCKHVFHVVPPLETGEEIIEDFESFAKSHREIVEPGKQTMEPPPPEPEEREEGHPGPEERASLEEDEFPKLEKPIPIPEERMKLPEDLEEEPLHHDEKVVLEPPRKREEEIAREEEKVEDKRFRAERSPRLKKKTSSRFFPLFVVFVLLVLGAFYLWTELESGGKLARYVEGPIKKVTHLWEQIWKTEKKGLIIRDLNGYEEKVGDLPLFIIEGKVQNQSQFTKKYVKVKVVILDQNKIEVATREAICGPTLGREGLKGLPPAFFHQEVVMKPQTEKEMVVPPDKATPFMAVFNDLSSQAREFRVEVVEAPNL
jgi:predicted Zn finger-like uncharacterized protein